MTSQIVRLLCVRHHFRVLRLYSKCLQSAVIPNIHSLELTTRNQSLLLSRTTAFPINTQQTARMFSAGITPIDFEAVKALHSDQTLLIDVREPKELQESGVLPGSVNIPLGHLENALKNLDDNAFTKLYGQSKPSMDYPLVFSCQSGRRSQKAAEIALKLGYKNVRNYTGGWTDWEKNSKA